MKNSWLVVGMCALALGAAPACATKKFVRTSVGEVNEKVTTMSKSLEETQERVRQNEAKIADVDTRATAASGKAQQTAEAANSAASAANTNATEVGRKADARASAIESETRKLIFETVLSEDRGQFKHGKAEQPDDAKAAIDQMVSQLKADSKNVYVEIEGHTDSTGDAKFNEMLGAQRAEAVKMYLYEHHQVPLHKINVVSYGEQKPVAPNNTKDGRAQNRRVVIRVLA
jgi:peptidoglycan-associated lipoprotein